MLSVVMWWGLGGSSEVEVVRLETRYTREECHGAGHEGERMGIYFGDFEFW